MDKFTEEDLAEMVLRLAHGIRNPLATIKTGIQLVQHLSQPTGDISGYLNAALDEVMRIDRIVKDMQHFVRMEQQTMKVVEIGEAILSAKEVCMNRAREAGVSIVVAGGPKSFVFVDGLQLARALDELLANAVLFSTVQPKIHISWARGADGFVRVHVDDGCPGITNEDRDRMKRPFYSSSTQGTGLGLNIVARFCSRCGGGLDWKNRESGGCRFTMSLPEFRDAAMPDH